MALESMFWLEKKHVDRQISCASSSSYPQQDRTLFKERE
jgi:hypothetical protein